MKEQLPDACSQLLRLAACAHPAVVLQSAREDALHTRPPRQPALQARRGARPPQQPAPSPAPACGDPWQRRPRSRSPPAAAAGKSGQHWRGSRGGTSVWPAPSCGGALAVAVAEVLPAAWSSQMRLSRCSSTSISTRSAPDQQRRRQSQAQQPQPQHIPRAGTGRRQQGQLCGSSCRCAHSTGSRQRAV